jgi:hypothetical protein
MLEASRIRKVELSVFETSSLAGQATFCYLSLFRFPRQHMTTSSSTAMHVKIFVRCRLAVPLARNLVESFHSFLETSFLS